MKKPGLTLYVSLIAIILIALVSYGSIKRERKIAFVLVNDLFNEFDYKKEMEKKYTEAKNARKKILDSLQVDLSVLSGRIKMNTASKEDIELFGAKRNEFGRRMELFEQENEFMSKQFDEQIIKQLNQYVSDFGKENKYDMIYGNTSNGSIMYGTDELNVTKEVVSYINLKYKGIK